MPPNGKPDANGVVASLPGTLRMTIVFDQATGHVQLDDAPSNRLVALGLLDLARHILLIQGSAKPSSLTLPPGVRMG